MLLETDARTKKWGWLFRTYVQWHAIAFLLSELCIRTKGEAVERAWRALEATSDRWWFPLNSGSPHGKGQQGFLWKPLRKLLAKAKAAREKEFALERASLALRNGQVGYDYSQGLDHVAFSPLSTDQHSSNNLDELLGASAPKLGEMPIKQVFFQSHIGDGLSKQQQLPDLKPNGSPGVVDRPGLLFNNLSSFGLDSVVLDVMDDMTYEGTSLSDYSNPPPILASTGLPSTSQPLPPSTTTSSQNFSTIGTTRNATNNPGQPIFGSHLFSNPSVDFGTASPPLDRTGQSTDSPVMGDGNMDWTLWDDMVNQYGVEGQTSNAANVSANGPGHLGRVHWF